MNRSVTKTLIAMALVALVASAAAAATTTIVVVPSQVPDETPPRIYTGVAPAGYETDSWQGPATGKSNWHARYLADGDFLSDLFPADAATLSINDIARISYYTNRPAGTPAGRDWWIQIYTRPTAVGLPNCASWYKHRLISNYNDHTDIGNWVQYATDGADPITWDENSCLAPDPGEMSLGDMQTTLSGELIEMFSVQTDSGWNGYDGYIDGLEIELTNGEIGRVNFEAPPPLPMMSPAVMAGLAMLLIGMLVFGFSRRKKTASV